MKIFKKAVIALLILLCTCGIALPIPMYYESRNHIKQARIEAEFKEDEDDETKLS